MRTDDFRRAVHKKRIEYAESFLMASHTLFGIKDKPTSKDIKNLFKRYGWEYLGGKDE
jgi:hypothetical protein